MVFATPATKIKVLATKAAEVAKTYDRSSSLPCLRGEDL